MATIARTPAAATEPSGPTEAVQALAAKHGIQVVEMLASVLGETLLDKFYAYYCEVDGKRILVVPEGQDPDQRLWAVRALLNHQGIEPATTPDRCQVTEVTA